MHRDTYPPNSLHFEEGKGLRCVSMEHFTFMTKAGCQTHTLGSFHFALQSLTNTIIMARGGDPNYVAWGKDIHV